MTPLGGQQALTSFAAEVDLRMGKTPDEARAVRKLAGLAVAAAALLVSSPAPTIAATEKKLPPDRAPSLMTPTEIRAYNTGLDLSHPYYIRCRKDAVVGSLARKLRVCRTNEEWKRFREMGNDSGREILDDVTRAPASGNSPAFDACPNNRC